MIIPVDLGCDSYDIILERGAIKKAGELLGIDKDRKVLVVTDTGVPRIYADTVAWCYEDSHIFIFPQGEKSKNFDTYRAICQTLCDAHFTRYDAVIAVGGGVVGDMAGFAASMFMRGVDFYNVPTTVLSQVDSSVGGKTAVDFLGYKNIIGAFYPPKCVVIDFNTLDTLPSRHVSNGLCEAVKMAATFDSELFEIFESGIPSLDAVITRAVKIKRDVVEADERESGVRRVLNFGHTLGHAIESSQGEDGLIHGECVALGMMMLSSSEVKERLEKVLSSLNLPCVYEGDPAKLIDVMRHDKKAQGDLIKIICCQKIGRYEIKTVSFSELQTILKEGV
jgi:3-dehydroquinate synthase